MRKVIVYIAASVDGYIAAPGEDLSFLSAVQQEGEDYGYGKFIATIDTVLIGRKTYDWVMRQVPEFPHADKESYVITHTPRPPQGRTQFYTGDPVALVNDLKAKEGQHIFVDGGGTLIHSLLQHDLVDAFYISLIPVLLGDGIRLFREGFPPATLELVESKAFEKGLVQLHYQRVRTSS